MARIDRGARQAVCLARPHKRDQMRATLIDWPNCVGWTLSKREKECVCVCVCDCVCELQVCSGRNTRKRTSESLALLARLIMGTGGSTGSSTASTAYIVAGRWCKTRLVCPLATQTRDKGVLVLPAPDSSKLRWMRERIKELNSFVDGTSTLVGNEQRTVETSLHQAMLAPLAPMLALATAINVTLYHVNPKV